MAKITFIHGEMSGSINGNTYSKNRGGSYVRARVSPVQPNNEKQIQAKINFGASAQAWASLSAAEKQSYRDFAGNTKLFNPMQKMNVGNQSGANAYTSLNAATRSFINNTPSGFLLSDDAALPMPIIDTTPFAVPSIAPLNGMNPIMLDANNLPVNLSISNTTFVSTGAFSFRLVFNGGIVQTLFNGMDSFINIEDKNFSILVFISSFYSSSGNKPNNTYQLGFCGFPLVNLEDPIPETRYVKFEGNVLAAFDNTKFGLQAGKFCILTYFVVGSDGTASKFASHEMLID